MAAFVRLLALALIFAACGDSDPPSVDAPAGTAVRIEIRPASQTLTQDRRSATLRAVAFDAAGNEVTAPITWHSSAPDQIAVDGNGVVTGVRDLGSAAIWAETDTARAAPALIASVELAPGTLALTDDQIVEVGTPVAPPGLPEDDGSSEVDVRLRGVAVPAVGTVVVPLEGTPVGGVVLSASAAGDEVNVRLRSAALPEMYAAYSFDWQLGLEDYPIVMEDPMQRGDVGPLPYEQTLERNFPPSGASAFRCTASISAYLDRNTVNLQLVGGAKFIFKSSRRDPTLPDGYLKIAIEGPLTLKGSLALRMKAGFKASAQCELTGHIPVYLGAFSLAVLPRIPIGVGVNVTADINVATLELGIEGENGFDLGIGLECPGGDAPCRGLSKLEGINRAKPLIATPSGGPDDVRTELGAQAYLLSGIDFLIALGRFEFKAVKATFGPVQKASLASTKNQADDRAYASDYSLEVQGKLEPGDGVNKVIKKLLDKDTQDARLGLELSIAYEVSKSPRGTFTVSKTSTGVDSPVAFAFDLRDTSYFLLGYNVQQIVVYKKHEDFPLLERVADIPATSSNQTRFEWEWRPKRADLGKNEFFAYVKTSLPVVELELAEDSSKRVEVVNICGTGARSVAGGDCELAGTLSWRRTTTTPAGTTTSTATASVTMEQDTSGPGSILFRPYGTWTATHAGTLADCTLSAQPNPASGTLSGTPAQGSINLTPDADGTIFYDGFVTTGLFPVTTTLACPGAEPFVQQQQFDFTIFRVFEDQALSLDPVTNRAMGTYEETANDGAGTSSVETWTWDLAFSSPAP